jgi:hypothetical protein
MGGKRSAEGMGRKEPYKAFSTAETSTWRIQVSLIRYEKSDYDIRLPSSEHIGSCTVTKNVLFRLRRASVRSEFEKGNQDPLYGPVLMIRRTISQPAI